MIKNLINILFILGYTFLLFSQEPSHYIVGKDVFDGINLYAITQDKDNSIWIASNDGLYNYDGLKISKIDSKILKNKSLFGLRKDSKGNIYCHNFSGQIFKIVNKKLELFYSIKPDLIGGVIDVIFDNDDKLLIATKHNIIFVKDSNKTVIKNKKGFFFTKRKDTVFYGTDLLKNKTTGIVSYYNGKETKIIEKDYKHHLMLTHSKIRMTSKGIYGFEKTNIDFFKINRDTVQKIKLNIPLTSNSRMFFSNNEFWFTDFRNGVYKITTDNLTEKPNKWFSNYYISGVFTDKEKNTWLLTFGGGIIIIPNLKIINHSVKNDKLIGVNKINNKIYVSTKKGKILLFHKNKFTPIFEDKKGIFEYFTILKNKLIVSNINVYNKYNAKKSIIRYNRKTEMLKDTLYFALHGGVHSYHINNFEKPKIITRNRSSSVLSDTIRNKVWISSITRLSSYQNGVVTNISHNNKMIPAKEAILVEDQVWVATENGIYIIINDKVQKVLTKKDGLLSNNIYSIRYEKPYLYFSTRRGLQQLNINTNELRNITYSNGLTKRVKYFEVLKDTVYAITTNGLLTFSFDNLSPHKGIYHTRIEKAIVNGVENLKNNDVLNPKQNNIHFSFLTTSFRFQKDMSYFYQLKGYDKKPIKAENGFLHAMYSKLPAGKYTFEVNSKINNLQNIPQSISFRIKKEIYKRSWFKILLTSILLLLLYFVYLSRVKMLIRKRKELEMKEHLLESSLTSLKAQMNPHFMFNAINSVQSLIIKGQKDNAYNYLTKVSHLIRGALNSSETTWIYLEDEIEQLKNYLELEKLRFSSNLYYTIKFDEELEHVKIPSMIIQPFIENAVKHGLLHKKESEQKRISINFKFNKDNTLCCYIRDNGVGRSTAKKIDQQRKKYKSFSTEAIKKRFNLLNEYLSMESGFIYEDLIENGKPVGTLVKLNIPYIDDKDE